MEGTTDIQQDSGTVGISEMSFDGSQEMGWGVEVT